MDSEFQTGLFVGFLLAAILFFLVFWFAVLLRPWLHALFSGAPVPVAVIAGMRLRGTPPNLIVDTYIALNKRGTPFDLPTIETVYLAQGRRRIEVADLATLVEQRGRG